mgnify:FL=1
MDSNQIIDALLSNQIDVALAAASGITAVAESKKPDSLKIFAVAGGDDSHSADAIIVNKDSSIKTIADLKDKKSRSPSRHPVENDCAQSFHSK